MDPHPNPTAWDCSLLHTLFYTDVVSMACAYYVRRFDFEIMPAFCTRCSDQIHAWQKKQLECDSVLRIGGNLSRELAFSPSEKYSFLPNWGMDECRMRWHEAFLFLAPSIFLFLIAFLLFLFACLGLDWQKERSSRLLRFMLAFLTHGRFVLHKTDKKKQRAETQPPLLYAACCNVFSTFVMLRAESLRVPFDGQEHFGANLNTSSV